jgi:hypothetical protein
MEHNLTLLAKVFRIQKIFEPLSKAQRLHFYNKALEMNETELADIMINLIETLEDYEK